MGIRMLFRRIAKHVDDQNWFAVGTDFLIVVIGVFIGIQVANWNSARADARAERALLERSHLEISQTQAADAAASALYIDDRLQNLLSSRRVILGVDARTELAPEECQTIGYSDFPLVGIGGSVAILAALRSTGELTLIRDETIVLHISAVIDLFDRGRGLKESNRPKITLLSRAFPALLSMGLRQDVGSVECFEVDRYDPFYVCDVPGMRASAAFRNAFGESVSTQFGLLELAALPVRQSLADLHEALDAALGQVRAH